MFRTTEEQERGFPLPGADGGDKQHPQPGVGGAAYRCRKPLSIGTTGKTKRGHSEVNRFYWVILIVWVLYPKTWDNGWWRRGEGWSTCYGRLPSWSTGLYPLSVRCFYLHFLNRCWRRTILGNWRCRTEPMEVRNMQRRRLRSQLVTLGIRVSSLGVVQMSWS